MLKIRGAVDRLKKMTKYAGWNTYSFTRPEAGFSPAPRSMLMTHAVTVFGGVPPFIIGSVMSVAGAGDVGVSLIAASFAIVCTPVGVRVVRKKRYERGMTGRIKLLLPEIILNESIALTEEHGRALFRGEYVEIPLSSGARLAIKTGGVISDNENVAGTLHLSPPASGIAEFDHLLDNLNRTNPDVAAALNKASSLSQRRLPWKTGNT